MEQLHIRIWSWILSGYIEVVWSFCVCQQSGLAISLCSPLRVSGQSTGRFIRRCDCMHFHINDLQIKYFYKMSILPWQLLELFCDLWFLNPGSKWDTWCSTFVNPKLQIDLISSQSNLQCTQWLNGTFQNQVKKMADVCWLKAHQPKNITHIKYKKHAIHKMFSCLNYDLSQFYYIWFFFLLLVIFYFTTRKNNVTGNNANQPD